MTLKKNKFKKIFNKKSKNYFKKIICKRYETN